MNKAKRRKHSAVPLYLLPSLPADRLITLLRFWQIAKQISFYWPLLIITFPPWQYQAMNVVYDYSNTIMKSSSHPFQLDYKHKAPQVKIFHKLGCLPVLSNKRKRNHSTVFEVVFLFCHAIDFLENLYSNFKLIRYCQNSSHLYPCSAYFRRLR